MSSVPWLSFTERKPLRVLSADPENRRCAFESVPESAVPAVDFEYMMDCWYGPAGNNLNRPARCDALYGDADGNPILVEFKAGKANALNLHRKLYDSLIALTEHAGYSFEEARRSAVYVVVQKDADTALSPRERLRYRAERSFKELWKIPDYRCGKFELGKQVGVTVRGAYVLTPEQFALFVRQTACISVPPSSLE